jgi:drug/metabolite transporter (DMT)-like permease
MEVAIALGFAILFGAAGDVLLSNGMRSNGEIDIRRLSDLPSNIRVVFRRPVILAGIVLMTFYFFSYIAALAYTDVSVANPMTALSYVLVTCYAALAMRERVSPLRWAGVALVTLGAVLVGISS